MGQGSRSKQELSCRSFKSAVSRIKKFQKWGLKGHLLSKLHSRLLVSCGFLKIIPSWAKFWRVKLLFIHFYRCQFWSLPVEPEGKAASRANNQWYVGAEGYKWRIRFRETTSQKYLTFWEMISQKCKMICKWWSLFDAVYAFIPWCIGRKKWQQNGSLVCRVRERSFLSPHHFYRPHTKDQGR